MLKRRAARMVTAGVLLALPVFGLTGCRTSPNVAAYVGDSQVTVSELESAVEARLTDEAVAAFAETDPETFTRRVLSLLVQEEVYAEAAERYDIRVGDDDVRTRIDELLGSDDPDEVFGQLAQQGIGRADVFENVRQQLVRREIAEAEGQAEGLSEEALRARYAEVRESLAQVSFGYITVPDQATADAVLAELTATPAAYAAVAARYPGESTLPALEAHGRDELPGVLAENIAAAAPNTGFTTAVPGVGGIVVTFVQGTVYPTFEEVRPQLENEASEPVDQAGDQVVQQVRADLGVTVNPRYGVLEDGRLVAGDGGVVDILGDEDAAAAPAAPAE